MAEDVTMIRTFGGKSYEVTVDGGQGWFHAKDATGADIQSATLSGLRERLLDGEKKALSDKRERPILRFWGHNPQHGVSRYEWRGLHLGHGKWMLRRERGSPGSGRWENMDTGRGLIRVLAPADKDDVLQPPAVAEVARLDSVLRTARDALDAVLNKYNEIPGGYVSASHDHDRLVEIETSVGKRFRDILSDPTAKAPR